MKHLVIFSHGKESGPSGKKINALAQVAHRHGLETLSIDYRSCKDETARVTLLLDTIESLPATKEIILVGSSMGGYVATTAANTIPIKGLFLLCPALYMPNYSVQKFQPLTTNIEIVHAWKDDIIPLENVLKFAQVTAATTHLLDDNHRLSESHEVLCEYFSSFLQRFI